MKLRDLLEEVEVNEGLMDKAKAALGMKSDAEKKADYECKKLMDRAKKTNDVSNGLDGGLTMVHNDAVKVGCDEVVKFTKGKIAKLKAPKAEESVDINALKKELSQKEDQISNMTGRAMDTQAYDDLFMEIKALKKKIANAK